MAKVDLHLHSKYSERPSEWFLQKLGAAESYSEPEYIYDTAKKRGMSFVTITDHNNIEGSALLAQKYPDAFTGVESTSYFPEDGCKVHILIYGLNPSQFDDIQIIRKDIYELRDYLVQENLAHSVAHATYIINGKLTIEHLHKLILLFDVFESINGGRTITSNLTWYQYLKYMTAEKFNDLKDKYLIQPQRANSWVKGFTGGSDDHAGIYIGETYTLASANDPDDFLMHIRNRRGYAKGRHNDFQSLVFAIYKIAYDYSQNQSDSILKSFPMSDVSELVFGEYHISLLDRLSRIYSKTNTSKGYKSKIAELTEQIRRREDFSIIRNLDLLYDKIAEIVDEIFHDLISSIEGNLSKGDIVNAIRSISAALPGFFIIVPFFSSLMHMNNNRELIEKIRMELPIKKPKRILWFTDTLNDMNGVSVTLKQLGWQFFAHNVDIRLVTSLLDKEFSDELPPNIINLPTVYDFKLPYYSDYTVKIPSILKSLRDLHHFEPEEVFISTPGPVGLFGLMAAKMLNIPTTGIYHTDFTKEINEIDGNESLSNFVEGFVNWFYKQMDLIRVPTRSYKKILSERGLEPSKMRDLPRQIDSDLFHYQSPEQLNGMRLNLEHGLNLLYVGRVSKDKNLEFLSEVYCELLKEREDINLIIAGDGPYLAEMKSMHSKYPRVQFLGMVSYDKLPLIYSQGDVLIFPSVTDTFGMVVLEAQCCELPAIVSDQGGPQDIIENDVTGYVLPALNLRVWVKKVLDFGKMIDEDPLKYQSMRNESRLRAILHTGWDVVFRNLLLRENDTVQL
ncbi:glycosyltransferase [bacterium]|nr:glycosyltransferase [bacterium]